ncbi:MAG: hypothetical protein AAFW84_13015 [Cyanobacteria bacterium J06635_15]
MSKVIRGTHGISIPAIVLGLGVLLTLLLQFYSRDGVLFSGDGGLKALLAQQWAAGVWRFDLHIPIEPWIEQLWQQDLYPFTPPYVYDQGDRFFITFPFTFPLVTAPFYALMGYRGLYVVPLVALWAIWWRVYQIGQRLNLSATMQGVALVTLIFAAPLSIYGAMYWEHTLAVALALWGVSLALFPKGEKLGLGSAIAAGILTGLSVWFRPEFLCLIAILGLLLAVSLLKLQPLAWLNPAPGQIFGFGLAMVATVLVFFGLNIMVYGHPLGIHALQIVEESSLKQQVKQAIASYKQLIGSLNHYFPMVLFALAAAIAGFVIRPLQLPGRSRLILLICLLFVFAVPLIIPPGAGGKQWGPRFYLILVPLVSLVVAQQLQQAMSGMRGVGRYVPLALFATACLMGTQINLYGSTLGQQANPIYGSVPLSENHERIGAAIIALADNPDPYVAMSHQFVAQQFWAALPQKIFFRTDTTEAVKTLAAGMAEQGIDQFLYVCYPHRDCPTPEESASALQFDLGGQLAQLDFSLLGEFGLYPIYQITSVFPET